MDFSSIIETLVTWALGGLVVAYLLDYLRGWVKAAPSWVWRILVVIVSAAVAVAKGQELGAPLAAAWWNALGILAFSQGAYKLIVSKFGLPAPSAPAQGEPIGFQAGPGAPPPPSAPGSPGGGS